MVGRNVTPPGVSLPGPFERAGYPTSLATYPREKKPRFVQRLLYENGLAQVGFSSLHEPHRLYGLSPVYLRLTHYSAAGEFKRS